MTGLKCKGKEDSRQTRIPLIVGILQAIIHCIVIEQLIQNLYVRGHYRSLMAERLWKQQSGTEPMPIQSDGTSRQAVAHVHSASTASSQSAEESENVPPPRRSTVKFSDE